MLDILRQRRSIRHYTSEPLAPEIIDQLKEALLRSPSSRGLDPWEFVFVTDKALLTELATAKPQHAHFLRDAALGIVVLGNEAMADTWIEDCSIATIIVQLACTSLSLGSCWVQIYRRDYAPGISAEQRVRQIVRVPESLRVLSIVSIGHPARHPAPHAVESLDFTKIKTNTYN